ncbi:hypothetical protein ARMSODRAFT_976410, partial [Armillaria solidipes]
MVPNHHHLRSAPPNSSPGCPLRRLWRAHRATVALLTLVLSRAAHQRDPGFHQRHYIITPIICLRHPLLLRPPPPAPPPAPPLSSPLSEDQEPSPKSIPAAPVPSSASRELRKQSSRTFNVRAEVANSPTPQPNPKDAKYTIPPDSPYPVLMSHIPGTSSTAKLEACAIHNTAIAASKAEARLSEKFDAIMKKIKVLETQQDHGSASLPREFLDCLTDALQILKDLHVEMLAVALPTDLIARLDELADASGTLLNLSPDPHMLQELFASSERVEDAVGRLETDRARLHGRLDKWHAWAVDHSRDMASLERDLNVKFGFITAAMDGLSSDIASMKGGNDNRPPLRSQVPSRRPRTESPDVEEVPPPKRSRTTSDSKPYTRGPFGNRVYRRPQTATATVVDSASVAPLPGPTPKTAVPPPPPPAPEPAVVYLGPVTWVSDASRYDGKALTGSVSALIQSHSAKPAIPSRITLHNCFYAILHFKEHRGPRLFVEKWLKGSVQGFKDVTTSTTYTPTGTVHPKAILAPRPSKDTISIVDHSINEEYSLSIRCWNIEGHLAVGLTHPAFIQDISNYDINIFQESHFVPGEEDIVPVPPGYKIVSIARPAPPRMDKPWGGVVALIRLSLECNMDTELSGPDRIVLRLPSALIFCPYILPVASSWRPWTDVHPWDDLNKALATAILLDLPIYMLGDLNGRIADRIAHPSHPKRSSVDPTWNERGNSILSLANLFDLVILNGVSSLGDNGMWTSFQGLSEDSRRSVIDYALCSASALSTVSSLSILPRLGWSDHEQLVLVIKSDSHHNPEHYHPKRPRSPLPTASELDRLLIQVIEYQPSPE